MRRMYSESELTNLIKKYLASDTDISFGGDVKVFENIVDKDGHPRFIEGDIVYTNPIEGVLQKYGKWSLSGSHLLIVLALEYANGTELPYKTVGLNLPEWIVNKIYPITSQLIDYKVFAAFASDFTTQNQGAYLVKYGTSVNIELANFTLTKDRAVRIAFDLLIDNE